MDEDDGTEAEVGKETPATSHRAKEGAAGFLPGKYFSVSLWLLQRQVERLDTLAIDIHNTGGNWITRSGILAAMIEAAIRDEVDW